MKQRVAIIATCLIFALCLSFLVLSANLARSTMNDDALAELTRICRLSLQGDSAAFDEKGTFVRVQQMSDGMNITSALYDASGALVGAGEFKDSLGALDQIGMSKVQSGAMQRKLNPGGADVLFAYTRLEDGRVFAVMRPAYTLNDALNGKFILLLLLAFVVAGVSLALISYANHRTNSFLGEVQRVLEDFSEGDFESRVKRVPGDSISQTARFNEVMGRVQDRVFRQRTHNQALNTVMTHMQNGILAVDDQLDVILVTPAAKHLLGITGTPEGMPIRELNKDVNLDEVLTDAMQQEGVYTTEVAIRSPVGRGHTPLRLYITPMMKDGRAVGAVALVEDITELRRLEQVRTDFAANVSHELKTPLTSIKGFVETLQSGAIDNPEMARKFLNIIMVEADRLTRLINDILSISKLESGTDEVPNQRIRIDEMVNDICDMLSIQASEKQVVIHSKLNEEPSFVMGNPDRLEQMLINLIENAIKYNKTAGSVRVSVFNSEDSVNISIADTGIGIAEENIGRMFERFYRVDKGRSRSMGGTGLGLAIVKHIIKSMGGMIEVHSKLGEGTEFLVTLPRATGAPDVDQNPFEDE